MPILVAAGGLFSLSPLCVVRVLKKKQWEVIRIYTSGQTVAKTYMDDTLPGYSCEGTIIYDAPFNRYDCEEDYRTAWNTFEHHLIAEQNPQIVQIVQHRKGNKYMKMSSGSASSDGGLLSIGKHIKKRSTILRTVISFSIAVVVSLIYSYFNYESYWKTTIFRTQTVDFNIMGHLLPTKLSLDLVNNDRQELQRTLNSNFGLFGIIVTDCQLSTAECPNQKIIAMPKTERKWIKTVTVKSLAGKQFDLLRDPAPRTAEWNFPEAYSLDEEAKPTGRINPGRVIGRVYYLRNVPLTFLESINAYFFSSNKKSTSYSYLGAIFSLSLIVWLLLTILLESLFFTSSRREECIRIEKDRREEEEILRKRLERFINLARNSLEQNFASELTNRAQEMRSILACFQADINNISHEAKHSYLETSSTTQQLLEVLERAGKDYRQELNSLTHKMAMDVDGTLGAMQQVVKDLRQFAKIEGETVDLTEQLKVLEFSKTENFRKRLITYTFNTSKDPIFIKCNPWRLRSIVKNVIYNANIALLQLCAKDRDFRGEIQIRCYKSQNKAYLEILDNGSGIQDEKVLKKLYRSGERINQEKDDLNGNGSIIVQQYLELHNGWIEEVSNRSEGGLKVVIVFNLL
jgi:signal transduction histidine kinase